MVSIYAFQKIIVSEVDDGQACLVCEDKCPGFASHPWRYIVYLYHFIQLGILIDICLHEHVCFAMITLV